MEDKGLLGKIIAIIPGLALMVGTLAVLRMYAVPWLGGITLFGIKGWPVQVLSLNYILLSIIFAGGLLIGLIHSASVWAGMRSKLKRSERAISQLEKEIAARLPAKP